MNNECGRARIVLPFHHSSFIVQDLPCRSLTQRPSTKFSMTSSSCATSRRWTNGCQGAGDAWQEMGLPSPRIPRRHEPDYARASVWFVQRARALELPSTPVRELLLAGDTAMSDGGAFRNLANAGGWPGWCFIGAEKLSVPAACTAGTGQHHPGQPMEPAGGLAGRGQEGRRPVGRTYRRSGRHGQDCGGCARSERLRDGRGSAPAR